MDSSEVGKYGTLRLMKRLEPDKAVASYPIDDEEITFGRDPSSSIRLYYDSVSAVHCKIVFHDRKAFLIVLGTNGLFVDGCPVFPAPSPSTGPVTVPLPNNSTIEIHKKRFQFCYPPKELRAALLATPSKEGESTPERHRRKRALRMSMIQSAQVFTPRPSQDPRENLRILKTPIKTPFRDGHRRESSPLKRGAYVEEEEDSDEEDEEIVLVEGNHPRVVEEDRDLVILEHVVVREPPPQPEPQRQAQVHFPFVPPSPQQQAPPQTPRRRPRPSLHRAVLIRSAQRTALRMEMEREEEREVDEVEETIQAPALAMEDVREVDENEEEADDREEERYEHAENAGPLSALRKSLDAVKGAWPFSSVQRAEEPHEDDEEQDITEAEHLDEDEDADIEEDESMELEHEPPQEETHREEPTQSAFVVPPRIPNRPPPLGKFMTPQAPRHRDFNAGVSGAASVRRSGRHAHVRYSVGGFTPGGIQGMHAGIQPQPMLIASKAEGAPSGPRRVRLMEPWKVEDIVVPVVGEEDEEGEGMEEEDDVKEEEVKDEKTEYVEDMQPPMTPSRGRRDRLTDEERQAIIERRRSALRTPDAFFGGQAPGSRRLSLFPLSPAKPSTNATPLPALALPSVPPVPSVASPTSSSSGSTPSQDIKPEVQDSSMDEQEDTSILLARMKQMVEGAKRRQSMGPRPSVGMGLSPQKPGAFSLLAPDAHRAFDPVRQIIVASEDEQDPAADKDDVDADPAMEDQEDHNTAMETDGASEPVPQEPSRSKRSRPESGESREAPTPSFRGVREMFAPPAHLETPRFEGMRQLFQPERVMETPGLEGVGDMLATPEGYRRSEHAEPEQEKEQEPEEPQHEHVSEVPTQEEQQHEDSDEHEHEQDEAEIEAEDSPHAKAPTRPTRGRKPASVSKTTSSRSLRSTPAARSGSKDPLDVVDEEGAEGPPPAGSSRVTRKPRLRSASADPDAAEPSAPAKPARRTTRKATVSPPPTDDPPPTKRRTRRTPTPDIQTQAKPPSSRRKARVTHDEDADADADPLDSIARASSPEIPFPEPVRRSGRGKLPAAIKEEDEEPPLRTTAATRGRRTGIPRGAGRVGAGASRRGATPQTAPAPGRVPGNKENTPDRQEAGEEEEEQAGAEASDRRKPAPATIPRVGTRGKVTRSVGRAVREPEEAHTTKTRGSRVKARK